MMVQPEGSMDGEFDVMIIGGGPAGLSAAIWCSDLNVSAVLFNDGASFGGQLGWIFNEIRNYPGIPSIGTDRLRQCLVEQTSAGSSVLVGEKVVHVDLATKTVVVASGRPYRARAVIIATGIRRRRLGLPGETELLGRGILSSGVGSRHEVAGKHVIIVGGGDAAVENAVILSDTADLVTLVHRGESFRARTEFVDAAKRKENVRVELFAEATSIRGEERFEALELRHKGNNEHSDVAADLLLVRIGTQPNTELFAGQIDLDPAGFVIVDANMSASIDSVYAVGDAAFPLAPTLSTAVGSGSIAAKHLSLATLRR